MIPNTDTSGVGSTLVVSLQSVDKSFGPVRALAGASMVVRAGECIGLVGHNGAGKSTFVNIINGRLTPTAGQVQYGAHAADGGGRNADLAAANGIRSVFQELSLCPNLSVLENYRIPFRNMPRWGWRKAALVAVMAALDEVFPGHGIGPDSVVADLSIAERQMVEIAIAFSARDIAPRLVILDEPTSSLDAGISHQLLDHVRKFCAAGGAVIFITHMMGEIFQVADRIVVMKDGQIVEDRPTGTFTRQTLVDTMGHVAADGGNFAEAHTERVPGDIVLRLPNGLSARQGEIVGLAGLAGHGQAEALARFYFDKTSTWRARQQPDVVFVAGDRGRDGIMPIWSILKNLSLATLAEFGRRGLVDRRKEGELGATWKQKIQIKTPDLGNPILSLSGGNQQKVLFAKALASSALIVIMDDPMRGVDVGTKKEVYRMIRAEAEAGRTFLWYSTETDEILECDRVFVFRDSAISAELTGPQISEENILRASFEMQEAAE
ncbi:sugar ABC transporter ATP-binding protein [Devosia beringensis]|uniref:sugar ABC transporter ATP-binding protein n=1 Tax=Devosia beringensis TaxID=2657486 RepID=UPI00186B67C2|nr:sugar ABC transporter ATP-binding protein [Devosia beringensis]